MAKRLPCSLCIKLRRDSVNMKGFSHPSCRLGGMGRKPSRRERVEAASGLASPSWLLALTQEQRTRACTRCLGWNLALLLTTCVTVAVSLISEDFRINDKMGG